MTVRDLIERLQELPQDRIVFLCGADASIAPATSVEDCTAIKGFECTFVELGNSGLTIHDPAAVIIADQVF